MSNSFKWKDLPTAAINPASIDPDRASTGEIVELVQAVMADGREAFFQPREGVENNC